jgi:hypothetical protein
VRGTESAPVKKNMKPVKVVEGDPAPGEAAAAH